MVDVNVEFVLGQEEPIEAEFTVEPDVTYKADIEVATAIKDHDKLNHRDYPDQHPESAITGLEGDLSHLQDQIDEINTKEIVAGSNISIVTEGNQTIINTATYIYEQAVASETWTINHNLNKFPSVIIVDSTGNVFYPAVEYNNNPNQCIVTMNGATTGKAYLN